MKNFFIGLLQIIIASVILNMLYSDWQQHTTIDLSYPKPQLESSPVVIIVTPTSVSGQRIKLDNISRQHMCKTYELYQIEDSTDYTRTYKSKLLKDGDCWFANKDTEVEILEYRYPYIRVRITSLIIYDPIRRTHYGKEGWIKA